MEAKGFEYFIKLSEADTRMEERNVVKSVENGEMIIDAISIPKAVEYLMRCSTEEIKSFYFAFTLTLHYFTTMEDILEKITSRLTSIISETLCLTSPRASTTDLDKKKFISTVILRVSNFIRNAIDLHPSFFFSRPSLLTVIIPFLPLSSLSLLPLLPFPDRKST